MRNQPHQQLRTTSAIYLLALFGSLTAGAQPSYTITDLGTLHADDQFSQGFGINNYGQVSGLDLVGGGTAHGFLWTPDTPHGTTGQMTDLGPSTFGQDGAYKVNDYGEVLINANGANLWIPDTPNGTTGTATSIGGLVTGFTVSGYGLNNVGQVVGYGYPGVTFLWTPSVPNGSTGSFNSYFNGTDFEPGFGYSSHICDANGVSDLGQVTGNFFVGFFGFPIIHSDPNNHYVESDIVSPVHDPGSQDYSGTGIGINSLGHLAGSAVFPGTGAVRPFFYDGSTMQDISDGGSGLAYGINSNDQVVGNTSSAGGFLYSGGVFYRLIDLIDPGAGWLQLGSAFGINDIGQIAGTGIHNGAIHAFLMTPQ